MDPACAGMTERDSKEFFGTRFRRFLAPVEMTETVFWNMPIKIWRFFQVGRSMKPSRIRTARPAILTLIPELFAKEFAPRSDNCKEWSFSCRFCPPSRGSVCSVRSGDRVFGDSDFRAKNREYEIRSGTGSADNDSQAVQCGQLIHCRRDRLE